MWGLKKGAKGYEKGAMCPRSIILLYSLSFFCVGKVKMDRYVHLEHPLCTKLLHIEIIKYIQTLLSTTSHNNALQDPLSTFSITSPYHAILDCQSRGKGLMCSLLFFCLGLPPFFSGSQFFTFC